MLLLGDKQSSLTRPVVILRDTVLFPSVAIPLVIGRPKSVQAINAAQHQNYEVIFVTQRVSTQEEPNWEEIYHTGTLARIHQVLKTPSGQYQVQIEGKERVELKRFLKTEPYYLGEGKILVEAPDTTLETEALKRQLIGEVKELVALGGLVAIDIALNVLETSEAHRLVEMVAMILSLTTEQRQMILETVPIKSRLEVTLGFVRREREIQKIGRKIQSRTEEEFSKLQREAFLREQLKSIQKELGSENGDEFGELETKIRSVGLPKATEEVVLKELDRLRTMPSFGPEVSYVRTYLDWIVSLPWKSKEPSRIDLASAQKTLNQDHYGLEQAKDRILEYLAVQRLTHKKPVRRPQILCFVGPPGVGKTSIGQSIARALGRRFQRISLGGVRDEAEIRGHRRTYVGAQPGRIIQAIKQTGTKNPVFMLDEIDKLGSDFRGDPSAALLEVLDPEQNHTFVDHYLEIPFDLSDVFFIATANILDTIPPALRDRLEIIVFPGYTEDEKFHIAKEHLIDKIRHDHGLVRNQFRLSASAIHALIRWYTREAGVRSLHRQLASLARKIARKIAEGKRSLTLITERTVKSYLGPPKFQSQMKEVDDVIGVVQGLAVTEAGGDVLTVEVTKVPGRGNLLITGQLGDVMKESAQAAMSYARSRLASKDKDGRSFQKSDWHVHVPAGAIPKDGPSAGIALATAIYSVASGLAVRHDVAMTGEVTLRGRVLGIGGVKQKLLAAHRAGIRTLLLPKENESDLVEIPKKVRKELSITTVETMDEVLPIALVEHP